MRYLSTVVVVIVFWGLTGLFGVNKDDSHRHLRVQGEKNPDHIVFYPRPGKKLRMYFNNFVDSLGVEFGACLYGSIQNDTLTVKRVEYPGQYQEKYSVTAYYRSTCSDEMIATVHAHPNVPLNTQYSPKDSTFLKEYSHNLMGVSTGILMYRPHGNGSIQMKLYNHGGRTQ